MFCSQRRLFKGDRQQLCQLLGGKRRACGAQAHGEPTGAASDAAPLLTRKVWFYVSPACSIFQRCAVSVDKLGLTVRPRPEQQHETAYSS